MGGNSRQAGKLRSWLGANKVLLALLLLAAVKSLLWTVAIPPWRAPDEPQHFGYVEHLSREHTIPLNGAAYLYPDIFESLARTNFAGITGSETTIVDPNVQQLNPAAQHPPLFYTLALPAYAAGSGSSIETQLYLVRLVNVLIFMALIFVAYRFARLVFPGAAYLQIGVPLLMIFHPQLGFISAGAMNDVLLTLLFTLFLYQLTVIAIGDFSLKRGAILGVVIGLGMLTKSSFMIAFPISLAVLVVLLVIRKEQRRQLAVTAGAALGISFLIFFWYFVRNYIELGTLQPVYKGERYSATGWLDLIFGTSFRMDLTASFLGNFSWMSMPLPGEVPRWFTRIAELSILGLVVAMAIGYWRRGWQAIRPWLVLLFGVVIVLFVLSAVYYELTATGTQGRYLFPAAFAIWSLLLVGLVGWMPPSWRPRATAIVVTVAAVFSTWALFNEFVGRVT